MPEIIKLKCPTIPTIIKKYMPSDMRFYMDMDRSAQNVGLS